MDKRIEELLPFYALDALTDEERQLVETYLAEHPEARQQLEEMDSAVSALPHGISPVEPSQRTRDALMARVAKDERARSSAQKQASRPRVLRGENILQTFSLGVATLDIVWVIILNAELSRLRNEMAALNDALVAQSNSLEQINTNLNTQLAQLKDEVSTLNSALVAQANALEQINTKLSQETPSAVITVSLKGTDIQPRAQGQLIVDPNSQSAVLVIAGLPTLEAGKTYQVWLINGGAPVSAGLLTVDANGQGVLIVTSQEAIGSFNSLGISIEPEGGSPQPTGEIVVLSEL